MRRLIVSTFASLDGIMQAPGGPEEDPTGGFTLGGWMFGYADESMDISAAGFDGKDRELVLGLGIGITNIVPTASARAEELSRDELRAGAAALEATVRHWKPRVLAVLGVTAYRQAFARPKAAKGRQDDPLGGAELWVLANPSGLNAHETIASLATSYRRAWDAAQA